VKIGVGGNYQGSGGRIAIRASNFAELSGDRGFETPSAPEENRVGMFFIFIIIIINLNAKQKRIIWKL